jgi:hypothetical protein
VLEKVYHLNAERLLELPPTPVPGASVATASGDR